jgi:hypothetical protein
MEQNDGFGFWVWGVLKEVEVAVGSQATDYRRAWRGINGLALGATVVANADAGLLTPDKGPPRASGERA